jgi:cystathionine gamma-lyase
MVPINATTTYAKASPGVHEGFEYFTYHNPTRFACAPCVASLEGGTRDFAFAAGLAATSTRLVLLDPGDHVIAMDAVYGGTCRLFDHVRRCSAGLDFSLVDPTTPATFEAAIKPNTELDWNVTCIFDRHHR